MKKIIITTAIFSAVLIGCNDANHKHNASEAVDVVNEEHDAEHNTATLNNDWVDEIVLNNGSKWEANIETTQGVANMLGLLTNNKTESLEDYHVLAEKLNEEKNTLVKECTMKGPSHDNLHVFLHPLIEKIDALMVVASLDKAASATKSIQENLAAYETFFQ